jgi:transposase
VPSLVRLSPNYNSKDYCKAVGETLGAGSILLHDRHPVHTSKATSKYMIENKIHTIELPPKAADINPIENIWGIMTKLVYPANKIYNDTDSLYKAVNSAWVDIQQDKTLRLHLVESMSKRLKSVVSNKGWFAKY